MSMSQSITEQKNSSISIELTVLFENSLVSGELLFAFGKAVVIMTEDGSLAVPASAIKLEKIKLSGEIGRSPLPFT